MKGEGAGAESAQGGVKLERDISGALVVDRPQGADDLLITGQVEGAG